MRYLMPVRMAAIQKSINNKCWRGCGEKETLLPGQQSSGLNFASKKNLCAIWKAEKK